MATEKDLRIGNWILDSETDEQYFQVEEIRKYVGNENWIYYRKGSIKSKEVEGIPLTEDILLKCSKSHEYFHDGVIIYKIGFIHIWTQNGRVWVQNPLRIEYIQYLHQLQNLIHSLTQQELEIKL